MERILGAVAQGDAELMVASHNQASVQKAARCMHRLGLNPATSGEPHSSYLHASSMLLYAPVQS